MWMKWNLLRKKYPNNHPTKDGVASPGHEESSGIEEDEETKNRNLKTMNTLRENVQKLAQKWDDKQHMFKECKTKHGCVHLIESQTVKRLNLITLKFEKPEGIVKTMNKKDKLISEVHRCFVVTASSGTAVTASSGNSSFGKLHNCTA